VPAVSSDSEMVASNKLFRLQVKFDPEGRAVELLWVGGMLFLSQFNQTIITLILVAAADWKQQHVLRGAA